MSMDNQGANIKDMFLLVVLVLLMALPGLAKLPVIDRDEARYAQASVQMIESGDYINIRFQDRARNKKPAGAYWAQVLSVKAFSNVKKREIWAHRLPSVLGAVLAVLATYLAGIKLLGRQSAFYGAALLSVSFIFVFEAHIAKTDALLLGFSTLCLISLAYLRESKSRLAAILFWFGLGVAMMIKGPILPVLLILCLVSLAIWERKIGWIKSLISVPGFIIFLLIVLPWSYLIWQETDGGFFREAIGTDLTPKLQGAQEKHPGPPGYYLLTVWLGFWPASLFLIPGLVMSIKSVLETDKKSGHFARTARFLLCWSVPFFIMLELVPTKLPHYPLIIYPALALMSGGALTAMTKTSDFALARKIGSSIFFIVTMALCGALYFALKLYSLRVSWEYAVFAFTAIIAFIASMYMWKGKVKPAFNFAIWAALLLYIPTYQYILPSLTALRISDRIKDKLAEAGYTIPLQEHILLSPHFSEPSLAYRLGTNIKLGQAKLHRENFKLANRDLVILDSKNRNYKSDLAIISSSLKTENLCLSKLDKLEGFNYAKGDEVDLTIFQALPCPNAP